ncbi:helix-turn-helix domain-containing protein [Paracidovorax sp. MALMAid1276]|uniref:helix-turn-helix domain-containing protein n=1 Tax=Paracidovorax sp. MALMAid1276 TaxID=3411631 RepID=UPI003B9B0E80
MTDGVTADAGVTAGTLLREARIAAGMHIAALAVALKVPVGKLEALEADNYEVLPDTVFVRALASSVCRTLKIDPAPVMALLPRSQSPQLGTDAAGLNAPVKGRSGKASASSFKGSAPGSGAASRSVAVVVLALLAGALALVYFPRTPGELAGSEPRAAEGPSAGEPASAVPDLAGAGPRGVEASPALPGAAAPSAAAPQVGVVSAATPASAPPPAAAASVPVAAVSVPSAQAAPSTATPASAPVAAAGLLQLRARSESWVQVKDASGAVVLQRNLAPAEVVSVSGTVPLAVVVGRADATEVLVRGKPFELSSVARENVARFEVK